MLDALVEGRQKMPPPPAKRRHSIKTRLASRPLPPHPQSAANFDKYVDALVEARKKKGISREAAADQVGCG